MIPGGPMSRYYYHIRIVGRDASREHKQRGNYGRSEHYTLGRAFAALGQMCKDSDLQAFIYIKNKGTDEIVIATGAVNLATLHDNLVAHN